MNEILLEIFKAKKTVAIYANCNYPDSFALGKIIGLCDKYILLEEFDNHGYYDGYSIINIQNIFRIETESKYIKKMDILNCGNTRQYKQIELENYTTDSLIKYCLINNVIVDIRIASSDMDVFGYIVDFKKEFLKIKQISEEGTFDGFSFVNINSIDYMSIKRIECRNIEHLCS